MLKTASSGWKTQLSLGNACFLQANYSTIFFYSWKPELGKDIPFNKIDK